jgi:hypothetical protein
VANLKYSGHLISVSVIFDTPNQYQFTPVVEIRRGDSAGVLNTILTHHVLLSKKRQSTLVLNWDANGLISQILESPRVSHRERQIHHQPKHFWNKAKDYKTSPADYTGHFLKKPSVNSVGIARQHPMLASFMHYNFFAEFTKVCGSLRQRQ